MRHLLSPLSAEKSTLLNTNPDRGFRLEIAMLMVLAKDERVFQNTMRGFLTTLQ